MWNQAQVTRGTRTAPSKVVKYKRGITKPKDGTDGRELCILQFTPDVLGSVPLEDKSRVKVFFDTNKKAIKLQVAEDESGTSVRRVGNWFRVVMNHVPHEVLPATEEFVDLSVGRTSDTNAVVFVLG